MSSKIATIKSLKTARDSLLNSAADKALTKSAFQSLLNKAPSGQINITSNLTHFNLDSVDTQTATITIVKTGDVESVSHSITLKGTTKTVSNNTASFTITGDDFKEDSIQIKVVAGNREAFLTLTSEKIEKHLNLYSDNPHIPLNSDGSSKVDSVSIQAGGYLGLRPVKLTNLLGEGFAEDVAVSNTWASDATWEGFNKSGTDSKTTLLGGHIYYCKIDVNYVSSTLSTLEIIRSYPLYIGSGLSTSPYLYIAVGESKTVGNLTKPTEDMSVSLNYYFYFSDGFAGQTVNLTVNRSIYDITDLIASSPKLQAMTDAELQTWCDTYIPLIGAGETWTVGGKARNLVKPHEEEWYASSVGQYGLRIGTPLSSDAIKLAHTVYARAEAKYTTTNQTPSWIALITADGYGANVSINNPLANTVYMFSVLWRIESDYNRPSVINNESRVYVGNSGAINGVVTYVRNNPIQLNLTTSGWLAQLSLMGIESDADVKAFIDTYVPFFEGEMDFPKNKNLSYTWSNDRNIPMVDGDAQTLHASQIGLKPIELTACSRKVMFYYHDSSSSDNTNGVYTVTSNGSSAVIYTTLKNILSTQEITSNILFSRAKVKNLASESANAYIYHNFCHYSVENETKKIAQNEETYVYGFSVFTEESGTNYQIQWRANTPSKVDNFQVSEILIVPVTELLATPHLQAMTDAEKLEWLNNYIPTIEPDSTWTVGGKATNLLDNPTFNGTTGWALNSNSPSTATFTVANNEATISCLDNGLVRLEQYRTWDAGRYYARSVARYNTIGNYVVQSQFRATGNQVNILGTLENQTESWQTLSSVSEVTFSPGVLYLHYNARSSEYIGIIVTKEPLILNLTTSGWLAQLSLMGIEGSANIKAWIDENVPFFEGETTFPGYSHITYTASCEGLTDTITIGTKIL